MTEKIKKIIFWSATIIAALGLLSWWVKNAQRKLESFRGGEFMEKLNFPKIEMPKTEIPKEELENKFRELEETIKNAQEISTTTE